MLEFQWWEHLKTFAWNSVWAVNLAALPPGRAGVVRGLRMGHMLVREVSSGQLSLHAMSLVYTTLLSLVPLLAVTFSVLKAFGVHNELESVLNNFLLPLGDKGVELTARILEFVENARVGLLGGVGLALLMFTVVRLLQKVEDAFNHVWRVRRRRRVAERITGYLSVLIIGPLMVFTAMGITTTVMSASLVQDVVAHEAVGWAVRGTTKLIPYLLVVGAFAFVYVYMPNTRVRLRSALAGAVVAGILWQSAGWAFATFVVKSTGTTAIYASFAILLFFMIWLYLSWFILLFGASVAFYIQNPQYLGVLRHQMRLSSRMKERVALLAAYHIARSHFLGRAPCTSDWLARRIELPLELLEDTLRRLEKQGILVAVRGDAVAYVPGRDLARISVRDVLAVVRAADETPQVGLERLASVPAVEALMDEVHGAVHAALGERTLRDMVAGEDSEREAAAQAGAAVPLKAPGREAKGR